MTSAVPPTPASPARRDPALWVVLGLIILLVAVALVVVFTRSEPALLDAGTPGGVVQRYSTAVLDGDETSAARYLSAAVLADCDSGETAADSSATDDIRINLVDTTERGSNADVRVLIVTSYGSGPFGSSEYEAEEAFELVRVDEDWLIDEAPWRLTVCPPRSQGDTP
ncbi:hypothetical protein B7495_03355 [Cryobacterium sp. LW097]|uniref:hypothetical protein n=1 Tax=Cryobacterium sp. LW097 TaxID=1978566 RepID=UPI000B4DEC9B|nr:hypothetical protein [Cryobacterium sp. LW097]ASD21250.1 hypothetical protein B7495_03355 [Cryobacterium sp. LW097]